MGKKHYHHQVKISEDYIIPLLEREIGMKPSHKVLEVGCAESGLVAVLMNKGYDIRGIELNQGRIDLARDINSHLPIEQGDITDESLLKNYRNKFDLIIIRDVIEHIPDKESALKVMNAMLKVGGYLYITFPPLYSPYAGHQQNAKGLLKIFLWVHLLPDPIINWLGKRTNASENLIKQVILNSKIGLTISRFEKMYSTIGFRAERKDLFFLRPIYKVRWGWPIVRFPHIPVLREVFSTGCEYLLQKN